MPAIDFQEINQALCGTLTTTPVNQMNGLNGQQFTVGGNQGVIGQEATSGYCYTYPGSYSYTDPRVTALQAKVEVLEKMLAAVLSGRDVPKTRARRK